MTFEIFFEVLQNLPKVLAWRIRYIGQASEEKYDQILEEAEMEDLEPGMMSFTFEVTIYFYFSLLGKSPKPRPYPLV